MVPKFHVAVLDWKNPAGIQPTGNTALLCAHCDGTMTGVFGLGKRWSLFTSSLADWKLFDGNRGLDLVFLLDSMI